MAKYQYDKLHDVCGSCGKRVIRSKKRAAAVAANMRRKKKEVVHHYKCPFGNGWHVGHPNSRIDWQSVQHRT